MNEKEFSECVKWTQKHFKVDYHSAQDIVSQAQLLAISKNKDFDLNEVYNRLRDAYLVVMEVDRSVIPRWRPKNKISLDDVSKIDMEPTFIEFFDGLTPTNQMVARLLMEGYSMEEIRVKMGFSKYRMGAIIRFITSYSNLGYLRDFRIKYNYLFSHWRDRYEQVIQEEAYKRRQDKPSNILPPKRYNRFILSVSDEKNLKNVKNIQNFQDFFPNAPITVTERGGIVLTGRSGCCGKPWKVYLYCELPIGNRVRPHWWFWCWRCEREAYTRYRNSLRGFVQNMVDGAKSV